MREQAHEIRHDAGSTHARPESLHASRVALMARGYSLIRTRNQGVVGVVAGGDRSLVRHNEDVAETSDLRRARRRVGISLQNVLISFVSKFVAAGHAHLAYEFA